GDVVSRWATDPPGKVWVAVGPEGGLADEELEAFAAAGAVPVSLGEQILRTETASVVVAALVLHHLGRLG
ncbi:MAG TPA: RsmE family RNA methyltransferase, partial [Actinomycetota bacterium]|nr:RsmE family RNA methyltransferase [Actinomycetota bacterium]